MPDAQPLFGQYDNRKHADRLSGEIVEKLALGRRLRARINGGSPMLYRNAGLHFRLPRPFNKLIYVYIRKNGCSAFKSWMLKEMGDARSSNVDVSVIAQRYAVSMEWHLMNSEGLLVLRNPNERIASLFRNKIIQRKGAADLLSNIAALTECDPDTITFREFVGRYVAENLNRVESQAILIDPHCWSQQFHLWPINYSKAIMLKDLPVAATNLFGDEIAKKYFLRPKNHTRQSTSKVVASDRPANELREEYSKTGFMPGDSSLLDSGLRSKIERIYSGDVELIQAAFANTTVPRPAI